VPAWCAAKTSADLVKQRQKDSISLELEFASRNASPLQKMVSFLEWEPNAYATGFFVGNGLVITAYHVVSGNLDPAKKMALGFGRNDQLEVKILINGCRARVVQVDEAADLALLKVCSSQQRKAVSLPLTIAKDEKVLLIARPHGERVVGYGTFIGSYAFNGIDYWSVKIAARDGFSGSPVYNQQGELVGVFSGYDWTQKLAVISPGMRAQKLLADFVATQP
jgi:S1-C subfamily serine protease